VDPCCFVCRGPHGVCLTRYACEHHAKAQAQDDANHRATRTHRDPTGETAVRNIMRNRTPKPKAAPKRPFSYPKEDQ
jgi:hypothetical protein